MKNNSATCLLIDDDEEEHEIFGVAVCNTFLPLNCFFFSHWRDALIYLKDQNVDTPDFLFLDWHMAGCESMDYINALKEVPRLSTTQFVIYSGYISQQVISISNDSHFKYLKKAHSLSDTTNSIRSLVLAESSRLSVFK